MILSEYDRRLNKVLDYIDLHLDAPLVLTDLAAVAHFSPFHFHRVFTAWLGETLSEYVQRRRLQVAAMRLTERPHVPILPLALSVGFGSGEAFSRAFKRQLGCTPSMWREQGPQRWAQQLQEVQARKIHMGVRTPDYAAGVQLRDFPPVRVAYIRHIGPYGAPLREFIEREFQPWLHSHQLQDQRLYGVSHDDPHITVAQQSRYDCCVELPAHVPLPAHANEALLPGGRYAVAEFAGTSQQNNDAWLSFWREWLPASGFQCDERPIFDLFSAHSGIAGVPDAFRCDLCLPVIPL